MKRYLKSISEFLAIAAPIICLFDCVVLPILSLCLPFLQWHEIMHGVGDQLTTALVIAICLPAIIPGVMKHRNTSVAIMFASGACLMLFTNMLGERIDSGLHIALTVATSILLLRANWLNRRLLSCSCAHHSHQKENHRH